MKSFSIDIPEFRELVNQAESKGPAALTELAVIFRQQAFSITEIAAQIEHMAKAKTK